MNTVEFTLAEEEQRRMRTAIQVGASRVDLHSGATQNAKGEFLIFLYQNAGAIFGRDELLRRVWNYPSGILTRTVDQTVATLRRKLNDDAARPKHLITVYGIGYQLATGLETATE